MIPLPRLWMKNFDIRNFLKHKRIPLRKISVQSDKKISTEKGDIPCLPPPPFLFLKLFETRKFLKHRMVHLRNFSVLRDNKFSTKNSDVPSLLHSFIHKNFRYQKLSETQKGSPTKTFGIVRQQSLDGKL